MAYFIRANGLYGVQIVPGAKELFCLVSVDNIERLYTTTIGLQYQLVSMTTSCNHVSVHVNGVKTKVMNGVQKRTLRRGERRTADGQKLEVVNHARLEELSLDRRAFHSRQT